MLATIMAEAPAVALMKCRRFIADPKIVDVSLFDFFDMLLFPFAVGVRGTPVDIDRAVVREATDPRDVPAMPAAGIFRL